MAKRILVIDDDQAIRKSFLLALESEDYEIQTAESGYVALEKIKKRPFDLIYLDLKMPEIDGVDTFKEIRKIDKDVPIYIVTAFHKEFWTRLQEIEKNGYHFELLHKPINSDQIVKITKGILDGPVEY